MYIMHVIIMKTNHAYEVAIKRSVAILMEVRELYHLASNDIHYFHMNLDSRWPAIETLNKINFRQEGDVLIFDLDNNDSNLQTKGGFMAN